MVEVGEAVVVDGLATWVQRSAGWAKRHAHTSCGAWGGAATPGACGVGCGEQRDVPSPYALVAPYPLGCRGAEEGQATRCRHGADERAGCVECHRHERGKHTGQARVHERDEHPTTCEHLPHRFGALKVVVGLPQAVVVVVGGRHEVALDESQGFAYLRISGGCQGCAMSQMTLRQG